MKDTSIGSVSAKKTSAAAWASSSTTTTRFPRTYASASLSRPRQAVAVLREDSPGDARIVGYVVGSSAGVLDALRATLPAWMIPSGLVELDSIPLTPNGKVDRAALSRQALGAGAAGPADRRGDS